MVVLRDPRFKCIDCGRGFLRSNGKTVRCPPCQAVFRKEISKEYKLAWKARNKPEKKNGKPEEYFYTIVHDPLQPEWHGKITLMSLQEGLRLATFSEGTVLRYGRVRYRVAGATAPYPFMAAAQAQRLEEI